MSLKGANSSNCAEAVVIRPDPSYIRVNNPNKQNKQHRRERKAAPPVPGRECPMFTGKQFRAKAAESAESLKHTDVPSEMREFQRSKERFNALADNEDWLADNFDEIIRSQNILAQDD